MKNFMSKATLYLPILPMFPLTHWVYISSFDDQVSAATGYVRQNLVHYLMTELHC